MFGVGINFVCLTNYKYQYKVSYSRNNTFSSSKNITLLTCCSHSSLSHNPPGEFLKATREKICLKHVLYSISLNNKQVILRSKTRPNSFSV